MPSRPIALALALLVAPVALLAVDDWPHLRGPSLDGSTPGRLGRPEVAVELTVDWRIGLGSGYSGIAIASGRAVTLFAAGGSDFVGAFDAATGEEIWRHRLAPTYEGHDGSHDGPVGSPTIADGRVFAVGPRGQLVALALDSGRLLWSKELAADFGSIEPDFGWGTTPLVAEGRLIVLTGGDRGRAIAALDPATGRSRWTVGGGRIQYQMPVYLELGGKRQLVTLAGNQMAGLRAKDGKLLWSYDFPAGGGLESSSPVPAGRDRFLVFAGGEAVVFGAEGDGVRELYRSRALGNTYALPVYHQGTLYGFRGDILSAVDAATGERLWRSRPPGGRGLILVGDRLVVFGAKGAVVVADASRQGYVERGRARALDGSGYTWPSFAGGRIFVRNLEEMAAVSVAAGGGTAVSASAEEARADHLLGRLAAAAASAEDPQAVVDAFVAEHPRFPIVDGRTVHFLYRGAAADVALTGTMLPGGGSVPMERIAGTDLRYRSYEIEPGVRVEYGFIKDFEERIADPRNPLRVPGSRGFEELSELRMPGYDPPGHVAEPPEGRRGRLETLAFESRSLDVEKELRVYLPPGYDETDSRYPLLLVHDGFDWLDKGLMDHTLDNLIGRRVAPVVAVFLKPHGAWWLEAGGSGTDKYVDMLADELVPFLEQRYRLIGEPPARAVVGKGGYGLTAAYAVFARPETFGKAALQSVRLGLGYGDDLLALIAASEVEPAVLYFDWNRYELADVDGGVDLGADSRRLAAALTERGLDFTGGEVLDSAGWAGWRARNDDLLEALFPAP